ncbi:MAG TPA: type VI secretion system-associated FHA domain protein TagH [Steroidobacteraceae bacterium]|nr:type VI secretion system-associated FHA domain protein TagH [Steroidobacteraceae bacterium]
MQLTLEVISPNGDTLGGNRRKIVGPEGARIGRARDNDWVISNQYLSRTHAQVRYVNGAFYIEGMGRNPIALNSPTQTVPNHEPQLLRTGDRFFLDEYEVKVTVSDSVSAPASPPPRAADPFAAPAIQPARSWDVGIVDAGANEAASLDPLAALGMSPATEETPLPALNIHQASVLDDHYRPPQPVSAPAGASKIPDAWDRSGFTHLGQPQSAPAKKPPATPAAPAASSIPDAWDKSRLTHLEQPRVASPAPPAPAARAPMSAPAETALPARSAAPNVAAPAAGPELTQRRMAEAADPTERRPALSIPADPPTERRPALSTPAAAGSSASVDLEELLRAAGLSARDMSPELAKELGQVLRIVVHGLMEVLQSRAEIKSQLRMNMTRMQAAENNPLKFSPNVEAALHTLLVERNRGYLTTTRAFEEALSDIRNHQIAVLQGIRTAFNSMLEHFDPERLSEEFDNKAKSGSALRKLGAKLRFQDAYAEQYASMTRDADESFRTLFGEYFAQAYEEQMERLKVAARMRAGK